MLGGNTACCKPTLWHTVPVTPVGVNSNDLLIVHYQIVSILVMPTPTHCVYIPTPVAALEDLISTYIAAHTHPAH